MFEASAIEGIFNKLATDLNELTNRHDILDRMTTEEGEIVKDVRDFLKQITENRTMSEAIESLLSDSEKLAIFFRKTVAFSQIIKNHQRQGFSQFSKKGKVEAGRRRIGKPGVSHD